MTISQVRSELKKVASPEKAKILAGFFKTGKGEYGEGDRFLGVVVPAQRKVARQYLTAHRSSSIQSILADAGELLQSSFHEERLTALLILVERYKKADDGDKQRIFRFYLDHLDRINNWDLVDLSAPNIVGNYLLTQGRSLLFRLAKNKNMWARRVAIVATHAFIRNDQFSETLALAELLLIKQKDAHDLMHKAVGWMLREVGKRDQRALEDFLGRFGAELPRTALRYAIERFPEAKRREYLAMGKPKGKR